MNRNRLSLNEVIEAISSGETPVTNLRLNYRTKTIVGNQKDLCWVIEFNQNKIVKVNKFKSDFHDSDP